MSLPPTLPESAPFTLAQRAWLNGFFAGLLSGDSRAAAQASAPAAAAPEPEDFPWHDPSLALEERLKLAQAQPRARMLMAAMAQLDCGQCGYRCQTYAEALALGAESRLSLCVPGGKDTSRTLRRLLGDTPGVAAARATAAVGPARAIAPVRFDDRRRLTGESSDKDIRHVVLHLNGSRLDYSVGDSFGIHASNCPELVQSILDFLGASALDEVDCPDGTRRTAVEALTDALDVARPSDEAIELLALHAREPDDARRLRALASGTADSLVDPDLLDLLIAFPSARPPLGSLAKSLAPLQPRLYSIASSPKAHPGEVHLTVGVVRYDRNGRRRKGVASTFLAERAAPGGEIRVFTQPVHGFRLPDDPTLPIVMIGPGTGVAPFRAFLEERRAIGANGRNWLFFGEQRREHDFLYREELEGWRREGLLTRLDLAFSRDQGEKVYVQHRMRENAPDLWSWLDAGAHIYVCGDAKRMARDVDAALQAIVAEQGRMDPAAAKAYVAALVRDGRYRRDVY